MSGLVFRAVWPIVDERVPLPHLEAQAEADLPLLLGQVHARLLERGVFKVADSRTVPGSGRVTPRVLVYEAPAKPMRARPYHHAAVGVAS
jgi:hypothetical protein